MSLQPPTEFDGRIENVTITAEKFSTALRVAVDAAELLEDESCTVRSVRSERDPSGKIKLVLDFTK